MLFNSPEYLLLFLPITLLIFYWVSARAGSVASQTVLIVASVIFYAQWGWMYLPLLAASIAFNYWVGGKLARKEFGKTGLIFGLAANLAVLGFFKYFDFFIININAVSGSNLPLLQIALPLGISFFTFQKIAYLVDCHKGDVIERDPVRFSLFVMFFPQLIAGPIVHHKEILPQLKKIGNGFKPDAQMVAQGLFLLTVGLFKKVVIADNLALYADQAFANAQTLQFLEAWTGALAYTMQLYFDFSAYAEMAMGAALLFGIHLPLNFNSPYKATSIGDFWRRWHMTLGRFLRDYVYIPLGGNRNGMHRMLAAAFFTMVIGGIWHGAGWTFIIWGVLHGSFLVVNKLWEKYGITLARPLAICITFLSVVFAWVMFRAASVSDAVAMWKTMAGFNGIVMPSLYRELAAGANLPWFRAEFSPFITGLEIWVILAVVTYSMTMKNVHEVMKTSFRPTWTLAGGLATMSIAAFFSINQISTFLYFQF